jgi:hypothetical protein
MTDHDPRRRQLLQLLATAPLACALGCDLDRGKQTAKTSASTAEESLKRLIRHLGPWTPAQKRGADDFAVRFVNSELFGGSYLPESAELIQSLANRLPTDVMAAGKINLGELPVKERELLVQLVEQIYSFVEVRFQMSDQLPFGQCLGNRKAYTKPPSG